jgi:hypothetical protein
MYSYLFQQYIYTRSNTTDRAKTPVWNDGQITSNITWYAFSMLNYAARIYIIYDKTALHNYSIDRLLSMYNIE